jgi:hypothetical protein
MNALEIPVNKSGRCNSLHGKSAVELTKKQTRKLDVSVSPRATDKVEGVECTASA